MGLKQERRVRVRELPEPLDQRVKVSSVLGPPLSGPKAGWLALVAGPFGVIAQFCDADQRAVRVPFRDEAACARPTAAAVAISPAGRGARAARRGGWVFVVLALTFQRSYLCPTCVSLSCWPVLVADHERRVREHDRVPSPAALSAQPMVCSTPILDQEQARRADHRVLGLS